MKIQINENESYEIEMPSEVNADELIKIILSLDNVMKLIRINVVNNKPKLLLDENGERKKRKISVNRWWCNKKEKVIDLMQYAYHGTLEDKKRIEIICKNNWTTICKGFNSFKSRFEIQPQEIGLTQWGTIYANGNNFKIPNWIIKSYTGIFDENGNS